VGVCMCGFCNVWMCIYVGFVMCGCFGNVYLYILCFCIVSFMFIYSYLFCLYWCKDYCHRATTQLQFIIIIIIIIIINTSNVEPEMYDYTSNNWSHWNSNEKLKEKFGSATRKTFDRFTTKGSYTWNITHNTESTAV